VFFFPGATKFEADVSHSVFLHFENMHHVQANQLLQVFHSGNFRDHFIHVFLFEHVEVVLANLRILLKNGRLYRKGNCCLIGKQVFKSANKRIRQTQGILVVP